MLMNPTVCRSKHSVLKLLIIIPGHDMVGRLGGGHIAVNSSHSGANRAATPWEEDGHKMEA